MPIEVRTVTSARERRQFLTFPWKVYKGDPLWVPPLMPGRKRVIDPERGLFFKEGYADLFLALREGKVVGTICCGEDRVHTETRGSPECVIGFFECVEDYAVAEALFQHAEGWARARGMENVYGTYNLDREEGRGILVEGRDRPPVMYCGHNPAYYQGYFERFGFRKSGGDGVAWAVELDVDAPGIRQLMRVAERMRTRREISVRGANLEDIDGEIERVVELQNRGLAHLPGFVPYTHASIEGIILPALEFADPALVLFAEVNGKAVGWFPGLPDMNEVLIHLNGMRHPWDVLRFLRYRKTQPRCLAVKSVAVLPEYWDTGVAVVMFAEMVKRAVAKGYRWVDLSVTGEDNPDTFPLAEHVGGRIYKRYRFYEKKVEGSSLRAE